MNSTSTMNNTQRTELDAFEKMRETFHRINPLTETDWTLLKKKLQPASFRKGDIFVTEGQCCTQLGYLSKGLARVFYMIDGKEITSYFNTCNRNVFVCAFTSFLSKKPSFENVHFLEDSELLLLTYDDLQEIYDKSPNLQKAGRLMAEFNYVLSMERIYSLQHASAIERYNNMLKIYAGLLNLVPHHYIASYLGITPESLSRIRKKAMKK
jgi:CRP-like cAMP-binding protein